MSQVQLPVCPYGTSPITPELAVERKDNQVVYFNGHLPVFTATETVYPGTDLRLIFEPVGATLIPPDQES